MPFGQTVTVFREVRNEFGDVEHTDERKLTGCAVYPRNSVEEDGTGSGRGGGRRTSAGSGAVQVSTGLTMLCPPGSALTATHRVQLDDGTVWQVVGHPARWSSPLTGWSAGEQVELERTTG